MEFIELTLETISQNLYIPLVRETFGKNSYLMLVPSFWNNLLEINQRIN